MIATLRTGSLDLTSETVHEIFLELMPQIRQQAVFAFRGQHSDARDELLQEVVANAYCAVRPARATRQNSLGLPDLLSTICHPSSPRWAARR